MYASMACFPLLLFFFNLTVFPHFLMNMKHFLPSGFTFFASQCPWHQGAMRHAAPVCRITRLCRSGMCFSRSLCRCCPCHCIPRNLPLFSAHISWRFPGACIALIRIYHLSLRMARKTHNHEFHESLWLVPDCLLCHAWHRLLCWPRSCS